MSENEEFSDDYWMAEALIEADKADQLNEVPVGCVIVLENQIIGRGHNKPISGHDPTAHAEIIAIREAAANIQNYRLINADIFVTIEPCTMCTGAIVHARFKRVVFGACEPKSGVIESAAKLLKSPWFNFTIEAKGQVLAQECADKISAFFKRRRSEKRAEKLKEKQLKLLESKVMEIKK
jgi:tRNA(adenine34) deaminase